jgi:dUTP pyrophosphatase
LNSPGTVDADYRGEIKVILINHGLNEFYVENGDRIAQGVIASVIGKNVLTLNTVKEINENTERNSGGFGSTGIK